MSARPSRLLRGIGLHAAIEPAGFTAGAYVLSIGGAEQSHVNLADPTQLFYEYLRRIGHLVDLAAAPGRPIRALHLGAGALTLARYIAVTRPGSVQVAVECERELLDFVLAHLPLPEGTELSIHLGDARGVLPELAGPKPGSEGGTELEGGTEPKFDAVVLDVFAGADAPEHLTTPDFYAELAAVLAPDGVLIVNVGDDPPLSFARAQIRALQQAVTAVAVLTEEAMLTGRYPGNLVLAGTLRPWAQEWTAQLLAAGPHPAVVLTGMELDTFAHA